MKNISNAHPLTWPLITSKIDYQSYAATIDRVMEEHEEVDRDGGIECMRFSLLNMYGDDKYWSIIRDKNNAKHFIKPIHLVWMTAMCCCNFRTV